MDPRLRVVIEVTDRASQNIQRMNRSILAQIKQLRMQLLFWGAAVTGLVSLTLKASEAQRMSMRRLELHAGKMGPAFAVMVGEIATQLGRDLGFTKSDIFKLATTISEIEGRPALPFEINASMVLARATGMSLEEAAKLIRAAINGDETALRLMASLGLDISQFTTGATAATEVMRTLRGAALESVTGIDRLKVSFSEFAVALGGVLGPVVDTIATWLARLLEVETQGLLTISSAFFVWWHALTTDFEQLVFQTQDLWTAMWKTLQMIQDTANSAILSALRNTWTTIKGVFVSGINEVVDKINAFIRMLNNIRIRIPVVHIPLDGSVGGGTVSFPQIAQLPRFQHGGVMGQGGVALVGEAGPELVALPGGSRVFPSGQGAGMGMTININGPVFGMPDLKRVIQEAVRDTLRGSGFGGLGLR